MEEFIRKVSERLDIDEQLLLTTEYLETRVLDYIAKHESPDYEGRSLADIPVAGQASVVVGVAFYDGSITIQYHASTEAERRRMVKILRDLHGNVFFTYEELFKGGFCADALNGIIMKEDAFFNNVLPNLTR